MTKRSGASRRKKAKERAAAAAVAYPPWVLLEPYCVTKGVKGSSSSSSIADVNTLAAGRSSAGIPINVALCVAPPPEESRVCVQVQLPPGVLLEYSTVLAAHGDSLLISVPFKGDGQVVDNFVYNAGDAAADPPRPPSLSLLPRAYRTQSSCSWGSGPHLRYLIRYLTGLLRRGADELVVADLEMVVVPSEDTSSSSHKWADLALFRSGEWSVKRLPINHGGGGGKGMKFENPRMLIPIGDNLLCWVDTLHGVIFSAVFDDNPTLRYVPYPLVASPSGFDVCVTAGGDTVKLIIISPRCCCGEEGDCKCRHSLHAYTIRTWTLRIEEDMTWVMDGMVDSTELWALDAYQGLPRLLLCSPVMSLDDPNIIIFELCVLYQVRDSNDERVWLVTVDMRSKSIPSIYRYPPERWHSKLISLIPSRVSRYMNSSPPSGSNGGSSSSTTNIHVETAIDQPQKTTDVTSSSAQSLSFSDLSLEPLQQAPNNEVSLEKRILMALEEVPGLARDEMLKAYSILIFDSGHRFRSLLGLPVNLRKDWLLIEVKASEACSTCSACTKDLQFA